MTKDELLHRVNEQINNASLDIIALNRIVALGDLGEHELSYIRGRINTLLEAKINGQITLDRIRRGNDL